MLPDPAASRAVLIGTSRYSTSLADLPAVEANLEALGDALCSPDIWGLPEQNCMRVLNPETPAEMIDPIVEAAADATDTLLVYFAGHGLLTTRGRALHLALTGSDSHNASYTAVPYEVIRNELIDCPVNRLIVILDCCYSGRALGGHMSSAVTAIADQAEVEGTYVIAAAAENRQALAEPGEQFTAFTGELLTVLWDGIPDKGPYLHLDGIYAQVERSLRAKGRPLPQCRVRNTIGSLALVHNQAIKPPDEPPPADFEADEPIAPRRARRSARLVAVLAVVVMMGTALTVWWPFGRDNTGTGPQGSSPGTALSPSVPIRHCASEVTVTGDFGVLPVITIPETCSPGADLVIKDLTVGSGRQVRWGGSVKLLYLLQTWSDRRVVMATSTAVDSTR